MLFPSRPDTSGPNPSTILGDPSDMSSPHTGEGSVPMAAVTDEYLHMTGPYEEIKEIDRSVGLDAGHVTTSYMRVSRRSREGSNGGTGTKTYVNVTPGTPGKDDVDYEDPSAADGNQNYSGLSARQPEPPSVYEKMPPADSGYYNTQSRGQYYNTTPELNKE